MSRIEQILEKAEREGSVRRVRSVDALAGIAAVDGTSAIDETGVRPVLMHQLPPIEAAALPIAPTLVRVVDRTELDRRLIAGTTANTQTAEQYRALRTRMLHADTGAAVHVVMVTSPGRGEGKTITAGNLGLTMAQEYQRRICVVDADLRHPQIHRIFGLPDGPGLAEVLAGDAALEEALITIEEHQITILPAGHPSSRQAELLGTTAMRRTIETLRAQFDRVVVDAPAAIPLADVGILTPLVDSILLVVRAAVTSKPAIHDAVQTLDGSKLLGIVLNEAR